MTHFAKAHAYGNDFLYVRAADVEAASLDRFAREICDRHSGVGADGLIVYTTTEKGGAMRLFNADGGRAEVSGNGVRALAAWLTREDDRPRLDVTIETEGGIKHLRRIGQDGPRHTFRAFMGLPTQLRKERLEVLGEPLEVVVLNMGNPQAILLGPLPDDRRFEKVGAAIEHHALFPDGTNVAFAVVEAPERVRIRIWERGVGPTFSSGTGSCAALVAAVAFGGAEKDAEVIAPGGGQRVEWLADGVYLTGWAEVLCEGQWLRPLPR